MKFKGTIIITDPCYVVKLKDWDKCDCGHDIRVLDEVRKYNPDIDEWIASHDWCVTTIPDFDGEVNYYVDKQGFAHIVGVGNVNFFTNQTGL